MNDYQTDSKPINAAYIKDFNRLAQSVETRCQLTAETPWPGELETQIALRSSVMKTATLQRELTAIRAIIGWFLKQETWPHGIQERAWVTQASMEDIGQLHSGLLRTASDFVKLGSEVSSTGIKNLMNMNFPGSEEDAARALAGMKSGNTPGKSRDKKNMIPITNRDFMELELHLSNHPHQNALKTLAMKRTDNKALLRIFMRVIRLTGMRPIEVFKCRIMLGDVSREYNGTDISKIYQAPYQAIINKMLIPIEQINPGSRESMSNIVKNTYDVTGIPPVIMIKAAKTTNANPEIMRPFRAQILHKITDDDLEIICMAGLLHHFNMNQKSCSNMITTMTRNLRLATEKALPFRKEQLNLYSFRHDFATRARQRLPLWEVAALMGHTAKASTYTYGKSGTRKTNNADNNWLPLHDAEFAEEIRKKWGFAPEQSLPLNLDKTSLNIIENDSQTKTGQPEFKFN